MLKTMWLSSLMTLTFNWIFSSAFSPVIESPHIPAPLYILFAVVIAVTIWRWSIMWKQRYAVTRAMAAPLSLHRRKAVSSHGTVYQSFQDTLQKCVPHWLLSHILTGRS
jgi:hypothetical protein